MKYIVRNKQLTLIFILNCIVSIFISYYLKNNFFENFLGYLSNPPLRYYLIVVSLIFNYLVYKYIFITTKYPRYKNRIKLIITTLIYEFILNTVFFLVFNLVIVILNAPVSFKYLLNILIIIVNYLIVSLTISLIIMIIDIFIDKRFISIIFFLFIVICIDFPLDHINFFYLNNLNISFNNMYIINYTYSNSITIFTCITILNIILVNVMLLLYSKKDLMMKKDDNNE